jgi:hypothetical protein
MKTTWIALALALAGLSACQSVPAERKNNCACLWEKPDGPVDILKGITA